jgi:hypothetical protein
MASDSTRAVFADFNDHLCEPPTPLVEEKPPAFDDIGHVREEAWTDGYLTGRKEPGSDAGDGKLIAKLLASLDALDVKTAEAVDAASLAVADLLITTVVTIACDDWNAQLRRRVRMIAEHIKPVLAVAPEFVLLDDGGTERRFDDIFGLSRALDSGIAGEDITIRWKRGEATISRQALLRDLREAAIPLSPNSANGQNARYPS